MKELICVLLSPVYRWDPPLYMYDLFRYVCSSVGWNHCLWAYVDRLFLAFRLSSGQHSDRCVCMICSFHASFLSIAVADRDLSLSRVHVHLEY